MPKATAIVSHPACALHDTGWNHPEHQGRLPAIIKAIYAQTPYLLDRAVQVEAPSAPEPLVHSVHSGAQVDAVRAAVDRAAEAGQPVELDRDTRVSSASWDAALGAVGAAVEATRLVLDGEAGTAFALTRPPGHHATVERAMGFCLFNNVAIAARWAQAERGVERVLILDWDVHHGNGTQDIFYADGSVYYLSYHLASHYPGTGGEDETGSDDGEGATRNVTFPQGADRTTYMEVFAESLREVATEFEPDLVLVSAGFDCLAGDPLGGLCLELEDLHRMTRSVLEAAGSADGRVVAVLEGGYVPKRVGDGVVQVIRALAGLPSGD